MGRLEMANTKLLQVDKIMRKMSSWGFSLQEKQAHQIKTYHEILLKENQKYNLTRITEPGPVLEEHFFDSWAGLLKNMQKTERQLLDLGSGAGFPGVPLKIYLPCLKLFLLDSSAKKISFLKLLVKKLQLEGVSFLQLRAEDLGRGRGREKYPWVTARAVAPLVILLELALPLVKEGGYFWAFKGPSWRQELAEAGEILKFCGGRMEEVVSYKLPQSCKERNILIFKKIAKTEKRFPRRPGIPQKRPLTKKIISPRK